MDPREQDTREKLDALERAVATGASAEQLFAIATTGLVAIDFRATDAMIGIPEVDADLVHALREATYRALVKASDLGHTKAALALGERIWQQRDAAFAAPAARALERTAEDDPTGRAHHLLAMFYFHGLGLLETRPQSFALHQKAAARGNADSMFELYAMLSQGVGVEPDLAAALEWCKRAAEAGNARAMYNLGAFHATGRDLPQDDALAVAWYGRAADAGHGRAAATLGVMLATGQGAPRDVPRAKAYLERAEELDCDWRPLADALGLDEDELFGDTSRIRKAPRPARSKSAGKKSPPAKRKTPKRAPKKAPKKTAPPKRKKPATRTAPNVAPKKKKKKAAPAKKKAAPAKKRPKPKKRRS